MKNRFTRVILVISLILFPLLCIWIPVLAGSGLFGLPVWASGLLLALGVLVSSYNLYLSFIFPRQHPNRRAPSGIPAMGTVLLSIGSITLDPSLALSVAMTVFVLADTGGLPCFAVAIFKDDSFF